MVPCQRHVYALPRRRVVQPPRVALQQLRALDAEQRGRFPGGPGGAHVPRRAAAAHEISIARAFPLQQRVLLLRDGVERGACFAAVGKHGEDLRVLAEGRAARKIDVAAVLPQTLAGGHAARERVAVAVKAAHHASSRRVTVSR